MPRYRSAQEYEDGQYRLEIPVIHALTLDEVFVVILGEIADDIPFGNLDHFNHRDWTDTDLRKALKDALYMGGRFSAINYDRLPGGYDSHPHAQNFRYRLARLFGFHLQPGRKCLT